MRVVVVVVVVVVLATMAAAASARAAAQSVSFAPEACVVNFEKDEREMGSSKLKKRSLLARSSSVRINHRAELTLERETVTAPPAGFGTSGLVQKFTHYSETCRCRMTFSVFFPPRACQSRFAGSNTSETGNAADRGQPRQITRRSTTKRFPALYFLSGLGCSDEDFPKKAKALELASRLDLIVVVPDVSPRGKEVHDDEYYAIGQGAGFYVNATQVRLGLITETFV